MPSRLLPISKYERFGFWASTSLAFATIFNVVSNLFPASAHLILKRKEDKNMKCNIGSTDRIIRALLALALGALYFTNIISGTLGIVAIIVAVVLLATSIIGFCPLYVPLKISTKKQTREHDE